MIENDSPTKRHKASGYSEHGASHRKPSMLRWYASSKSPHEDISENLETLRTRSRDLYAGGGPIGRAAIERIVLNALGSGLRLNVRLDPQRIGLTEEETARLASRLEADFDAWASSPFASSTQDMSFYDLQVLALRSVLLDGECIVYPHADYDGRRGYHWLNVQLIESERLATPPGHNSTLIDEGVELDDEGNPIALWIANRNPESEIAGLPPVEYKRIELYPRDKVRPNILHIFQRERIGQHRGVPFLAPVIEQLKQLSRYSEAELSAAVVSGMFAIFFEHEQRDDGAYGEEDYAVEQGLGSIPGLESMTMQEMSGTMMELPDGVKATSIAPGRPNQNFAQFVKSLVLQIGGTLGLPYEVLFMNFTSSYSASRGALLEAWKVFRYWRSWFAAQFCQPIYEHYLYEYAIRRMYPSNEESAVFEQMFYHTADYAWAEWVGPSQGQLDPVKEVNASLSRINGNLSTYQRECSELTGEDWDLVMKQRDRESRLLQGRSQTH